MIKYFRIHKSQLFSHEILNIMFINFKMINDTKKMKMKHAKTFCILCPPEFSFQDVIFQLSYALSLSICALIFILNTIQNDILYF